MSLILRERPPSLITGRYSDRVAESKDIRQMLEFASNMTQKLTNWHHDLPPSLVIDTFDTSTMYLPHVLQLQ
jgi:hypothetical protein